MMLVMIAAVLIAVRLASLHKTVTVVVVAIIIVAAVIVIIIIVSFDVAFVKTVQIAVIVVVIIAATETAAIVVVIVVVILYATFVQSSTIVVITAIIVVVIASSIIIIVVVMPTTFVEKVFDSIERSLAPLWRACLCDFDKIIRTLATERLAGERRAARKSVTIVIFETSDVGRAMWIVVVAVANVRAIRRHEDQSTLLASPRLFGIVWLVDVLTNQHSLAARHAVMIAILVTEYCEVAILGLLRALTLIEHLLRLLAFARRWRWCRRALNCRVVDVRRRALALIEQDRNRWYGSWRHGLARLLILRLCGRVACQCREERIAAVDKLLLLRH
jgi:hypothetical protein